MTVQEIFEQAWLRSYVPPKRTDNEILLLLLELYPELTTRELIKLAGEGTITVNGKRYSSMFLR